MGINLSPDFKLDDLLIFLPNKLFETLALKVMKMNCTYLVNDHKLLNSWIKPIFKEILRDDLCELNLTGFMTHCKEDIPYSYFKRALYRISALANNIEVLQIFGEDDQNCCTHARFIIRPREINCLKDLHHLRELQIKYFTFYLKPVMDLCFKVPTLVHVNINLEIVELPDEEELILKLGNLKAFQCDNSIWDHELFTKFILLCLDKLTELQLIGIPCSPFCATYEISDSVGGLGYSNLRHLSVGERVIRWRRNLPHKFPLVSHLKIDLKDIGYNVVGDGLGLDLVKFTKITSLNLQFISLNDMFSILRNCGLNLRELHVAIESEVHPQTLSYALIFELCPSLEKIYMKYKIVRQADPHEQEQILSFANINELKMNMNDMVLNSIVFAPELKKVEIICEGFNDVYFPGYLNRLELAIKEESAWQKLEQLAINMHWRLAHQVNERIFKAVASLVKLAARNLRSLSVIKLKLNYRLDYIKLAKALNDENETEEEIQEWLWDDEVPTVDSLRCIVDDDTLTEVLEIFSEKDLILAMADKDENVNLNEHIHRIASKLGIDDLKATFNLRQLSKTLPEESFVPLALKLLKTKCTFLLKNETYLRDLKIYILNELINRYDPKELDLTGLMTFCFKIERKLEVLNNMLACQQFKNIEVIRIFSNDNRLEKFFGYTFEGQEKMIKGLEALHHLRELQINLFAFRLNEVMDICFSVPTLEHINVILGVQQVPDREELMFKLGKLKAFQCIPVFNQVIEIYSKFIMMCMENLTKLQLIGSLCSPFSTNYEIVKSDEQSSISSLRHLRIHNWVNRDFEYLRMFPHVTHLKIDFADWTYIPNYIKNEKIFKNIESLSLINITRRTMSQILQTYGFYLRELHALVVDEREKSFSGMFFTKIWKLCPNLEKVHVNYTINETDFETDQKNLLAVSKINELKIDLKTMICTKMVTAPQLKELEMDCEFFHDDLILCFEYLCRDIRNKKILQKLEHLTIDMRWFHPQQVRADHFRRVASLVKCVTTNVPKLSVVEFKLNYRCDYLKLAKALKDVDTTNEDLQMQGWLWNGTFSSSRNWLDFIEMAEINLSEYLKELGLKLNDKKITERISRVASKLKINLSPSFDREELLALPNDALENLSLKLMTTKCQYLVRDQNEFLNVMTPLFYGLLTPRLKALDLTGYMTFCKDEKKFDSFRTAIFGIYFCAKNIKKLQILNDGDAFSQFAIDELLRDTLKGFKNLRKLDIDFFTFNLEDVMNICHKVPTLKYINSNFKFEEIPSEQDLKKKLANLKGFQFKLVGQHDWKALIKRCMYYVRNLQVIGTPYIPFCTTYKIDDWTPLRTSNLRYMGIDNSLDWENYFPIMYSYVQNLSIDWNVWNEPSDYPLRKFEGIKTLTLLNIPVDSVIRLLIVHGIHLLELYVTVDASSLPPLTYSRIFELCPRLQKIYLHDIHNQSETIESFANINELKLDLDTLENSNILNAPDLQKVQLIGVGRSTKSYDSLHLQVGRFLRLICAMDEANYLLDNYTVSSRFIRIARKLNIQLGPDFNITKILELPVEVREALCLKLLKTKCSYIVRLEDELSHLINPTFLAVLSPSLKTLDLTGLITFCCEENKYKLFRESLVDILRYAPNIEELLIFSEVDDENFKFPDINIKLPEIENLKGLQLLRELQIELFTFDLPDLMNICSRVPTLQYLRINLMLQQLPNVEQLRKSFAHLKVFEFDLMVDHTLESFNLMCMENLPNLQVIESRVVNTFDTGYKIDHSAPLPPTGISNLRHLNLDHFFKWRNCFLEMCPFLTHLMIQWGDFEDMEENQKILQFSQIKSLTLETIPVNDLYRFLHAYGRNLLELHVVATYKEAQTSFLSYNQIFNLCPNLEKIFLFSENKECFSSQFERINSFANISELKLDTKYLEMSNIPDAPGLRKIDLVCYRFSTDQLNSIIHSISQRWNKFTVTPLKGWQSW
ncbi:Hypothetical predicted protein [Cloeon dipterum]|uniref:Uncharacterized protein n=1 Tax=Cloeon dipterum TaxID=197152 RepID=A0A8S1E0E8_9INSE|nr:Hypothetical predicted protein [Cloeon dipterum]